MAKQIKQGGFRAEKDGLFVDLQIAEPVFVGGPDGGAVSVVYARVVDKDIKGTEAVRRGGASLCDAFVSGDVARDADHAAA